MNKINEKFVGLRNKINKRFFRFLGFFVLAISFVWSTWFLFIVLRIYLDIFGTLKMLGVGTVLLFFIFIYLLPRFTEMKLEKRKWLGRVISSLGGLFMSFLFVYFAFFQIPSIVGGLFSIAFALFLAFHSFAYLTYNPSEIDKTSLHQSVINHILNNRGRIVAGMFIILFIYIIFVIITAPPQATPEQTAEQVKKIHNTKITMDDVLGTNPPQRPEDPDKTVEGYDANNNGIRDDVELDIFEAYPNSQKTRAVLLQYALTQQMAVNQPFVNAEIANAVAGEDSMAYGCVGDGKWIILNILRVDSTDEDIKRARKLGRELREFIEKRQDNTSARERASSDFYEYLKKSSDDIGDQCDIDISTLPN